MELELHFLSKKRKKGFPWRKNKIAQTYEITLITYYKLNGHNFRVAKNI